MKFKLSLFLCVILGSTSVSAKEKVDVPDIVKEYRKHCHSLAMNDLTPYADQLEIVRKKAFVCRDTFGFPEADVDKKTWTAIRKFLKKQEPGTSGSIKNRNSNIPNVLDSYSYRDSEIEKLQIVIDVFGRFLYGSPKGRSTQKKMFLLAEPNVGELNVSAFLKGKSSYHDGKSARSFGRADLAMAYAAYKSINPKKLDGEMKAWKIATPAYKRVVAKWLDGAKKVTAKLDELSAEIKGRSPAGAGLFKNTYAVYKDAANEAASNKGELKQQAEIIAKLIEGTTPTPEQCEQAMLKSYKKFAGKKWKHGIENPIASRTRALAETCVSFRDTSLRRVIHLLGRQKYAPSSPFSTAAVFAQSADLDIVNDLGNTVKMELTYGDYYKAFLPKMVKNRPVFLTPNEGPMGFHKEDSLIHDGEIKILDIKKVKIAGNDFLMIGGKAKKVKTPEWSCTLTTISGWEIAGNQIRRRTNRKCKVSGHKMVEPTSFHPMLVPAAFAGSIKKGTWYKFLRVGNLKHTANNYSSYDSGLQSRQGPFTKSAIKAEVEEVIKVAAKMSKKHELVDIAYRIANVSQANSLKYAVPICKSKSPEKCFTLGSEGNPFTAEKVDAFKLAFE